MPCGPDTYLVMLAGGEGTRFAPLSTPEHPKQFLQLFGPDSMVQSTYARFAGLIPPERVYVTTNTRYLPLIAQHLPGIPAANIIGEPCKKNTAPALVLAAAQLCQRDPDAIMICAPSDQMVARLAPFLDAIGVAVTIARTEDYLVTLGITPDRPAVEYGYIERDLSLSAAAFLVKRFVEKPDRDTALAYLASGRFYWNSGIFIWRAAKLLAETKIHAPELARALEQYTLHGDRDRFFAEAPNISIDYCVMERSRRVATVPVQCGWSDVGSWEGLRDFVQREGVAVTPEIAPYLASARGR